MDMQIGYKPELYKKTVDILFNAYFNDTLQHGNCYACAVGNLIANNAGILFQRDEFQKLFWKGFLPYSADWSSEDRQSGKIASWYGVINGDKEDLNLEKAENEILISGYSSHELTIIENAFEQCEYEWSGEDYMFKGLVAVLEALKEIHQVTDDEESLPRFQKHYSTLKEKEHA